MMNGGTNERAKPGAIRVLLAEDEPLVRAALAELIDGERHFVVVAAASDADEAVELAELHRPDVALLDVRMPGGGGERAAREIIDRAPGTRVIALSAHDDRDTVLRMLRAGAVAYLVKEAPVREILRAIHEAMVGRGVLSNQVAGGVIQELAGRLRRGQRKAQRRQGVVARIQEVLARGGPRIVYQPIVDLDTRAMVGMEALARFPEEVDRTPWQWFADAVSVGLRSELELASVAAATSEWGRPPGQAYLALNVSPETASSPELMRILAPMPPSRVVIEVTEHARITDYASLNRAIAAAREEGLRLAIDDAGAGFASLRHIVLLSPDIIKLDMALTRDIDTDRTRRALAAALITFGSEIGAAIVAEGIETPAELDALRSLGVRYGQGFHLAPPAELSVRPEAVG